MSQSIPRELHAQYAAVYFDSVSSGNAVFTFDYPNGKYEGKCRCCGSTRSILGYISEPDANAEMVQFAKEHSHADTV